MIVDRTLIEFKTTTPDKFERVDYVYQLLGYILLDYDNEYDISSVGVYLARRGLLVRWALTDLLAVCCDTTDLARLRRDFRELLAGLELPTSLRNLLNRAR